MIYKEAKKNPSGGLKIFPASEILILYVSTACAFDLVLVCTDHLKYWSKWLIFSNELLIEKYEMPVKNDEKCVAFKQQSSQDCKNVKNASQL